MYYPTMASIIKKIKKGHAYWYAVESQRVNGKPRIVWQKYLGKVETIVKATQQATAPKPSEARLRQFGAVAAILGIAEELDVLGIIDRHIPRQRKAKASVGQYMLLAAINRACDPRSKLQIGSWYEQTVLARVWKAPVEAFTSQQFWYVMERVTDKAIAAIEKDLVDKLLQTQNLDLQAILYDTTNFATFIDTLNDRNTVAQRGHAKKKRHDLRLVGLALVVAKTFNIPLFHRVYAGKITDTTQFGSVILELADRFRQLAKSCEQLTLVFDKGNNSENNFTSLELEHIHFVASLVASQHPDLLDISIDQYKPPAGERWTGMKTYRCMKEVFGQQRTVVITLSESFFTQQAQALLAQTAKCVQKLEALAKRLRPWHQRERRPKPLGLAPTYEKVVQQVSEILSPQHMTKVLTTQVKKTNDGIPILTYATDHKALHNQLERVCGKTILFTDRHDWSTEEIIDAYRSQSEIEDTFRNMNDWDFLRWMPMFHWTDQKIRVHAFYCVLAVMLVGVLRKKVHEAGLDLSTHALLEKLSRIYELVLVYPSSNPPAPPRLATTLSAMDATQKSLAKALALSHWHRREG